MHSTLRNSPHVTLESTVDLYEYIMETGKVAESRGAVAPGFSALLSIGNRAAATNGVDAGAGQESLHIDRCGRRG